MEREQSKMRLTHDIVEKAHREHHERFVLFAYKLSGDMDLAEDLVSEIYVTLTSKDHFVIGQDLKKYFFSAIYNRYLTLAGKEKRRSRILQYAIDRGLESNFMSKNPFDINNENDPELERKLSIMKEAIEEMPYSSLEAYHYRVSEGLSALETSKLIGKTEGAVKIGTYRAYRSIRKTLGKHGIEWKSRPRANGKRIEKKLA